MSQFQTRIPVDVEAVKSMLPEGHYLESVSYDSEKNEVVILWEHHLIYSGMTIPIDFTQGELHSGILPVDVRKLDHKKARTPRKWNRNEPPPKPKSTYKKTDAPDLRLTYEQYAQARDSGKSLEFQGVTGAWKPVTDKHVYVEGYFYREAQGEVVVDSEAQPVVEEAL